MESEPSPTEGSQEDPPCLIVKYDIIEVCRLDSTAEVLAWQVHPATTRPIPRFDPCLSYPRQYQPSIMRVPASALVQALFLSSAWGMLIPASWTIEGREAGAVAATTEIAERDDEVCCGGTGGGPLFVCGSPGCSQLSSRSCTDTVIACSSDALASSTVSCC
jgi:hypothetical protein